MLVLCRLSTSLGETKHEIKKNLLRCRRVENIQVNRIETAQSVIRTMCATTPSTVRQTASLLFPVRNVQVFSPHLDLAHMRIGGKLVRAENE